MPPAECWPDNGLGDMDRSWEGDIMLGLGDTGGLAFGWWGTGEAALSVQLPAPGVLPLGWVPPMGPGFCGKPWMMRALTLAPTGGY